MPFWIKENDTKPYLPFQIVMPDETPVNLSTATAVKMAMRPQGSQEYIFKKDCNVLDATQGLCEYRWEVGDTAVIGTMEYEFEITWSDGTIQTVPADTYLILHIVDDIA